MDTAVDTAVCAGDTRTCGWVALMVSEGLLATASEGGGLEHSWEACGGWDMKGCLCLGLDSSAYAWDVMDAGRKSVDAPDMRSAAAAAPGVVRALLLVQLLAKPTNAVVEACESAAWKLMF